MYYPENRPETAEKSSCSGFEVLLVLYGGNVPVYQYDGDNYRDHGDNRHPGISEDLRKGNCVEGAHGSRKHSAQTEKGQSGRQVFLMAEVSYTTASLGMIYGSTYSPYDHEGQYHHVVWSQREKGGSKACQQRTCDHVSRESRFIGEITEKRLSHHVDEPGYGIKESCLGKGYSQFFHNSRNESREKRKVNIIYEMGQTDKDYLEGRSFGF
jgi:hypothetical protein